MKIMKIKYQFFLGIFLLICFNACSHPSLDFRSRAEKFIQTYYLKADPKGTLKMVKGPAAEKIRHELDLLKEVSPSKLSEHPKMTYQILSCKTLAADRVQCNYRLEIQMDRLRERKGRLYLYKTENAWWVTQFIEAPYED